MWHHLQSKHWCQKWNMENLKKEIDTLFDETLQATSQRTEHTLRQAYGSSSTQRLARHPKWEHNTTAVVQAWDDSGDMESYLKQVEQLITASQQRFGGPKHGEKWQKTNEFPRSDTVPGMLLLQVARTHYAPLHGTSTYQAVAGGETQRQQCSRVAPPTTQPTSLELLIHVGCQRYLCQV